MERAIRSFVARTKAPGVAATVVRVGSQPEFCVHGFANLETGAPVELETRFKIGSVTKQFLAATALALQSDGVVDFDRPLVDWVEGVRQHWKGLTLRHLLHHTSGLGRDLPSFDPYRYRPAGQYLSEALGGALYANPGERWLYSNLGYFIVAGVLERATGVRFDKLMQMHALVGAGMESTSAARAFDIVPGRADSYQFYGKTLCGLGDLVAVRPSGALLSTIGDLAKWMTHLLGRGGRADSPLSSLCGDTVRTTYDGLNYGLGLFVAEAGGQRLVRHGGGLWGFRAETAVFPDSGLGVAVLSNLRGVNVASLALELARDAEGAVAAVADSLHDHVFREDVGGAW